MKVFLPSGSPDFMVKAIKMVMLKESMLVLWKEGNMEYSRVPALAQNKKIKVLELLIEMIQNFPLEDPAYDKLQDDLEKIRGRFKQVCVQFHFWNTNCTQHVFRKNNIIVMKHNRNRRG
ncbi:protein LTO1 homolog isoform X7 [Crotalus tigris]|uniref:protein LTO1 homolog isoform X7 n=1 Tax=Crotalus tigris TaxID=88082 RepID=UPI00192FA4A3|nr:protein LTO1 homolog isoform X7 [Crotalus tigris]